jgi:capsular exopolysaccharide synthesis family protein
VSESFELRVYIDVLRRRRRVIAAAALGALVLALLFTLRQDRTYRAHAEVLLRAQSTTENLVNDSSLRVYAESFNVARQLTNAVKTMQSGTTRDAVAAKYSGPLDPDDVEVSVQDSSSSDVVTVSMTSTDAKEAAELVNLYVDTFLGLQRQQRINDISDASEELQRQLDDLSERIADIRRPLTEVEQQLNSNPGNAALESRRDDLTQALASQLTPLQNRQSLYQQQLEDLRLSAGVVETGGARLLTKAETPTDPVAPRPVFTAVLALILGALLGLVLAFFWDNLDEKLRGMEDLERAAPDIPPMAAVPEVRGSTSDDYLPVRDDARGPAAEAFRSLRTSVKFAGLSQSVRVIQVTSSLQGEGKTTVAANLAAAFAIAGERVALVCCDLRRPRVQRKFDQPLSPGFTNVMLGELRLAEGLRQVTPNLFLLAAGSPPPNPSELLSSSWAKAIVDALAAEFDVVIIDSTPVLPVTDALVVSRMVDATLVVVDVRTTKRKELRQTLQRLEQVGAPVIGLVLNGVGANDSYLYGYGYGYGYEAEGGPGRRTPISAGTTSQ